MRDIVYSIALIILIVALIIGFIWGLVTLGDYNKDKDYKQISRVANRSTLLRDGYCCIEIAPGMFVREQDLKYYLDQVRPVE